MNVVDARRSIMNAGQAGGVNFLPIGFTRRAINEEAFYLNSKRRVLPRWPIALNVLVV